MVAARAGKRLRRRALLLDEGANPNARGARGQTALMWAVAQKHPDVVKALLAGGADVHARIRQLEPDDGRAAARPPRIQPDDSARRRYGADVRGARRAISRRRSCSSRAGANVNDHDAWGVSATTLAAFSGYGEMARYLLDKGADPNNDMPGFTRCTAPSCGATSRPLRRCSRTAPIPTRR